MELTKEFIETNGLSDDAVKGINTLYNGSLADAELSIEQKYKTTANDNAEGIIEGATKAIKDQFGLSDRNDGEKVKDYLVRLSSEYSGILKTKEESLKANASQEYLDLKQTHDDYLLQTKDFDLFKSNSTKYSDSLENNIKLNNQTGFLSVKPTFGNDVNEFEASHKWSKFEADILAENDITQVDGVWMAVNKVNKFKVVELKSLMESDASISELMKVRAQGGLNIQHRASDKIEGLEFELPENATNAEISAAINKHLDSKGVTSDKRSDEFSKLWTIAKKK